ncbi:MAG: PH domain-containing protein [Emcibacter sp.]|nr:PH domain-containing protein [Emcibacter sp.]
MPNWTEIETCKFARMCEAFIEIFLQIVGISATYCFFNYLGNKFINPEFGSETLFSLLLLPALLILKSSDNIISPWLVKVRISETDVEATTGIFTKTQDKLELRAVENIEVISTMMGRLCNYSTISLYGNGSSVWLPHIRNADTLKRKIEEKQEVLRNKSHPQKIPSSN